MADRNDSVAAVADGDTRLHRIRRFVASGPLVIHVIIGSAFLVLLMPFVHTGPTWSSDEGAVRAQVEVIAIESSWSRVRPFSQIDPEGSTSPIHASTISGDQYYPYTKRPAYPTVLVPVRSRFGQAAVVFPSLVGTILAALAGAKIAGLLADRIKNVTFWILVVGSPIFFYGYTVTAHTLAAAASTVAMFVVLQAPSRRGYLVPVVAGGSIFLAVALRSEAVLFGAALAIAIVVFRPLAGRYRNVVLALVVAGSTAAAHVGSIWWAVQVSGVGPVSDKAGILSAGRLFFGMVASLVGRDHGGFAVLVAVVMTVGGSTLLALAVHRESQNDWLQRLLAGVSVAGSFLIAYFAPVVIVGLVIAMPLLVAGLVVVGRSAMGDPPRRLILLTSLMFVAAVVATQGGSGGGVQWGGRYFILAVPMLVAVAVASLEQLLNASSPGGVLLVSVLAIATVSLSLNAALVLRTGHARSQEFNRRIALLALDATYEAGRRPVVVSSQTHLGRHVWMTLDDVDYFLVPAEEFDVYLRRLASEDLLRIGVYGDWDDDRETLFESVGYAKLNGAEPPFVIVVRADM